MVWPRLFSLLSSLSLLSFREMCALLHETTLFCKNTESRTRGYVNNSRNLPTSRTQRTQGRNIPFEGTPHSDIRFSSLVLSRRPKILKNVQQTSKIPSLLSAHAGIYIFPPQHAGIYRSPPKTKQNANFPSKHRKPHAWIREQLSKSAHLPDPTHAGTKYPVRGNPSLRHSFFLFGSLTTAQNLKKRPTNI